MSKLGIGLIGCGGMGRGLARQLREIEEARLAGVTDASEEAAQRAGEEFAAPVYPHAEALLERPDVEAVLIATPGFLHRPLAEQAAAHGKHVFVEKPMATTTADCDAMIAAAERAGVLLMVGQVLRFYPCWWKVIDLVRGGEIGVPYGIAVTRIGGDYGLRTHSWRQSLAQSGGLLMEVNSHEIDFMRQICGEVERVYAEADRYGDDPADFPNLCFVSLRFRSGAVGLLHSSTLSTMSDLSGKVLGSEGTLFYTNGFGAGGEIVYRRRDGEPQRIRIAEIDIEDPVRRELRLFVEAIRKGEPSPIPGIEGRRNVEIAEAAYESARTGRPVFLP